LIMAKPVAISKSKEEISWKNCLKVTIKWISGMTAAQRVNISKFLNYPLFLVYVASLLPLPHRKKMWIHSISVHCWHFYIIIYMYIVTVYHRVRVTVPFSLHFHFWPKMTKFTNTSSSTAWANRIVLFACTCAPTCQ
jgi:hypothetical protein